MPNSYERISSRPYMGDIPPGCGCRECRRAYRPGAEGSSTKRQKRVRFRDGELPRCRDGGERGRGPYVARGDVHGVDEDFERGYREALSSGIGAQPRYRSRSRERYRSREPTHHTRQHESPHYRSQTPPTTPTTPTRTTYTAQTTYTSHGPRTANLRPAVSIRVLDLTSDLPDTSSGRDFSVVVGPSTSTRSIMHTLAPGVSGCRIAVREEGGQRRWLSEWERVFDLGERGCRLEILDGEG